MTARIPTFEVANRLVVYAERFGELASRDIAISPHDSYAVVDLFRHLDSHLVHEF